MLAFRWVYRVKVSGDNPDLRKRVHFVTRGEKGSENYRENLSLRFLIASWQTTFSKRSLDERINMEHQERKAMGRNTIIENIKHS